VIHVIATIELPPGKRAEFLDLFRQVVPLVRQEAGCLEYGPTVDVATQLPAQTGPRDNVVTVVEQWDSLAALEAHLAAPHMQDYRQRVAGLVLNVSLQILTPVE
jgi:quinol monooxygenase YgiN